ncbi:hypothetical protein [Enterobacter ludwigii]
MQSIENISPPTAEQLTQLQGAPAFTDALVAYLAVLTGSNHYR